MKNFLHFLLTSDGWPDNAFAWALLAIAFLSVALPFVCGK